MRKFQKIQIILCVVPSVASLVSFVATYVYCSKAKKGFSKLTLFSIALMMVELFLMEYIPGTDIWWVEYAISIATSVIYAFVLTKIQADCIEILEKRNKTLTTEEATDSNLEKAQKQ